MRKLLSLVLSVSMLVTSITPALGQRLSVGRNFMKGMGRTPVVSVARQVPQTAFSRTLTRRVLQQAAINGSLQARIDAGQVAGIAQHILTLPAIERLPLLRKEFVSLSLIPDAVSLDQRLTAASEYQLQLKDAKHAFTTVSTDLSDFLTQATRNPLDPSVVAVRHVLEDASALGLVGTREQAADLLSIAEQAQGTAFEESATLIAARGLLRMQAYESLETLLQKYPNESLAGVAAYIQKQGLAVTVPASLAQGTAPVADEALADFLGTDFLPNRLQADPSLMATAQWMSLGKARPASTGVENPVPAQLQTVAATSSPREVPPTTDLGHGLSSQPAVSSAVENASLQSSAQPLVSQEISQQTASAGNGTFVQPAAQAEIPVVKSTNRSGVLYSGLPVFTLTNGVSKFVNWLRSKASKPAASSIVDEEPGLHESTVRPVYATSDVPEEVQIGGDLIGADDERLVQVGADGFKLTVEDSRKVEHILHNVDLTVSSSLKNFSSNYNRLALNTNHIFELRNQTIPSKQPDHFYFALSIQQGEFAKLLEGVPQLSMARPLRIKIQHTASPKKSVTLPVYDMSSDTASIVADVDIALLSNVKHIPGAQVVYHNSVLYVRTTDGEMTPLENAFVRLPKEESKYWTQILAMYPDTHFHLGVMSTMNKMPPVTYLVPSLQIGLGKTLSPVLNDMSALGETTSSAIMLGINNVLPVMMGFVHPLLKRYGEAAVFRVGTAMFSAGGLIALASGLYGHVGPGLLSNLQLAGFLTSSILIALGTNITRFVQNLIMSANRGIVPQGDSFKKKTKVISEAEATQGTPIVYNGRFLAKRAWEVLTKKSQESLRDVVFYQRGAMFKNLGTMVFLSYPWLANLAAKGLFGVELGLDFSASYVPYALYSLYTLHKVSKTPYKDAFPLNLTLLRNNLQDVQSNALARIVSAEGEISATHPAIQDAAKQLKGVIDGVVQVESRQTKKAASKLVAKYEAQVISALGEELRSKGFSPARIEQAQTALQEAFDALGHRNIKLKDVILMAGMPAALTGMTMATLGELGLSNGLAFAMRELVGNSTAATGIVGILLYGCMFGWRIVGNILSQRMSGGSMYAVSSAAGVAGPLMMAMAGNNIGLLSGGAIIACFGISNFFSQMYEYMVGLHPKYKREIALLVNYTMPLAAVGAAALRWIVSVSGISGLDMGIAGLAMAASVLMTPGMLANSSMVRAVQYGWQRVKANVKKFFKRPGQTNLPTQASVS